jgi:hypothetical protein
MPSTIKTWNSLNNTIRNVDTLSKFKSELKKIDETANHAVPKHIFISYDDGEEAVEFPIFCYCLCLFVLKKMN